MKAQTRKKDERDWTGQSKEGTIPREEADGGADGGIGEVFGAGAGELGSTSSSCLWLRL